MFFLAFETVVPRCSMTERIEFHANHPFLYHIWNMETNTPIFTGRIIKFDWKQIYHMF